MFELPPVMGVIVSVRYMKFDFHKQYWVEVKTVGGGRLSARLCPADLERLTLAGYNVSEWGVKRNRVVKLDAPIEASFINAGIAWSLCEVVIVAPVPVLEFETGEAS